MTYNGVRAKLPGALLRAHQSGLEEQVVKQWCAQMPTVDNLYHELFECRQALQWHKARSLQAVTTMALCEHLVKLKSEDVYSVSQRELMRSQLSQLPPPSSQSMYHLFCSPANDGATELLDELAREGGFEIVLPSTPQPPSSPRTASQGGWGASVVGQPLASLRVTQDADDLNVCDFVLVYLTRNSWAAHTERSAVFEGHVSNALRLGVQPLLVHEMPDSFAEEARQAVEFDEFLKVTPQTVQQQGLYHEIALSLVGGPYRRASIQMLLQRLYAGKTKRTDLPRTLARQATKILTNTHQKVLHTLAVSSSALPFNTQYAGPDTAAANDSPFPRRTLQSNPSESPLSQQAEPHQVVVEPLNETSVRHNDPQEPDVEQREQVTLNALAIMRTRQLRS